MSKKSLKVGDTWEIGVTAGSDVDDENPPTVQVDGPFGARTFAATKTEDGKYVVLVVVSQSGDYSATNSDGTAVGSATAK